MDLEAVTILLDAGANPRLRTTGVVSTSALEALVQVATAHAHEAKQRETATAIAKKLLAHGASFDQPVPRVWQPHTKAPTVEQWILVAGPEWLKPWASF